MIISFFEELRTDDLDKMTDAEISDFTCCDTKKLSRSLLDFLLENQGHPYTDPAVIARAKNYNLEDEMMRPFNIFAIKIMRKLDR